MEYKSTSEKRIDIYEPLFTETDTRLELEGRELKVSYAQISVRKTESSEEARLGDDVLRHDVFSFGQNGKLKQIDLRNLHYHLYYEFFFIFDDEMLLVTEKKTRRFKNAIVCVPPYLNHYAVFSGAANGISVGVQTESEIKDGEALFPALFLRNLSIASFTLDEKTRFYLNELNSSINLSTESSNQKKNPLITLLTLHLFELTDTRLSGKQTKANDDRLEYVRKIELILSSIYSEDVKLSTIAKKIFLSEKQVSRIIKQAYNSTLSDLILDKKMAVAVRLISETNKSIAEISKELNFKNESYFFVQFKKYYGCTPLSYRKCAENHLD